MRKTLFWTGIYCTIAFTFISLYNIWYDSISNITIHDIQHFTMADAVKAVTDNQQQIINNQQFTHLLTVAILIFLLVRFYYQKHPAEAPAATVALPTVKRLTETHPDIPAEYLDDPKKKSIDDRKQDIVNHNNHI